MEKNVSLLICLILAVALSSFAQQDARPTTKGQVGISFSSFGNADLFTTAKTVGGPGYSGDGYFSIGINYLHPLNKTLDLESGMEFSNYKITIHPGVNPENIYPPYGAKFSLINIPLYLRVNFAHYFFVTGGLFLGVDASPSMPVDSQTGIGANVGLGLKYDFKGRVTAFVNPYIKVHSLVSFASDNHSGQHLIESGFRFGFLYRLK